MLGTLTEGLLKWKAAQQVARQTRATTVSVCSRKGGVGKTTTTVHMAVAAARWHHARVLVVDMDPQGHVMTALSSIVHRGEAAQPLSQVFSARKGDVLDACLPTDIPNLWVVPADHGLEQVQQLLATRIGREFVLRSALQKAQDMFDMIFIDCPPNLDTLTVNALVASQHVIVPTDLSVLGMEGVSDICEAVETVRERLGLPLEVSGILVSRVDARNKALNRELDALIERRFGSLVLRERIPGNTAVSRACLQGRPVYDIDPGALASEGFRRATEEMLDRLDS
jgi:chromosome partitioning protein